MDELIARLEAATEGSRELDREIAEEALGLITEWESVGDKPQMSLMVRPLEKAGYLELPCFTTSLDAALTLVPEGKKWSVGTGPYYEATVGLSYHGNCPSSALALCIAALKARAHPQEARDE